MGIVDVVGFIGKKTPPWIVTIGGDSMLCIPSCTGGRRVAQTLRWATNLA
ncbi:Hypothetical protein BFG00_2068 [Corynebacterium pseudotuberculosis]|nr:Hypothetical protein BFF96_2086 [Corynebacterium pseudotuberculosis]AUY61450.1 Hypothetical protein BFG00_2068 [Corynebacterium pseudotuberculosis]